MASLTSKLKWLKDLLRSLGVIHTLPMNVKFDSYSTIYIAQNPVFHERTKHIEIDCHFLWDAVLDGTIQTSHVSTTEQIADLFTKSLGQKQFELLLRKLSIQDLHTPT
ncbi:hypothetical protein LIER_33506 [Lithospermum erythrorhizon]|uniref:Copia protein n=1 Tax=Lithospermum erythrorhizon TaxID=34254 RepID=A0AAV3RYN4_LITER